MHPEVIEKQDEWAKRFGRWQANDALRGYPWVENVHAPLTPVRRALPLLNLALISSAGGSCPPTFAAKRAACIVSRSALSG